MTNGDIIFGMGIVLIIIAASMFYHSINTLNLFWAFMSVIVMGISCPVTMIGCGTKSMEYQKSIQKPQVE